MQDFVGEAGRKQPLRRPGVCGRIVNLETIGMGECRLDISG
jgi:hypothetical protein